MTFGNHMTVNVGDDLACYFYYRFDFFSPVTEEFFYENLMIFLVLGSARDAAAVFGLVED